MAIVYNKMGINIWEVIAAASTKPFGYVPFYPGPGVGGHCIPLDPFYLTYKAREYDYHTRLIELSGEINDNMPGYVVERLMDILNEHEKPLKNSKIMLLGIAYKGDIDDLRESPALKVWDELEAKEADVIYHDPYCKNVVRKVGRASMPVCSTPLTPEILSLCDAVVITTWHKHNVDYQMVLDNTRVVFDTKNAVVSFLGEEALAHKNLYRL